MPCNAIAVMSMVVDGQLTAAQVKEAFEAQGYRIVSSWGEEYVRAFMSDGIIQLEYHTSTRKLEVSCVGQRIDLENPKAEAEKLLQEVNQIVLLQQLLALPGIRLNQEPAFANGYLVAAIEIES